MSPTCATASAHSLLSSAFRRSRSLSKLSTDTPSHPADRGSSAEETSVCRHARSPGSRRVSSACGPRHQSMNCSCVHSGGRAASSTRLYINTSGREQDGRRAADEQAGQPPVRVELPRRDERGLGHPGPPHLTEKKLLAASGVRGQAV